jgi:hypothetical protein
MSIRVQKCCFAYRGGKTLSLFAALVALVCGRGYGQDTNLPPVAPEDLQLAARVALGQGVNWLKQKGADDPDGWISGPFRQRKVIEWTNIVARYSKKKFTAEYPVYEYSNVVTFIPGSVGEAPRKVVQQRPVKQIGTRKVEREDLVGDPEGTIIRQHRRPLVYDKNGTVVWYARNLGDAALTAYALQQAGVPETDPVLQRMLENLRSHVDTYGLPDQTWNLAWLTAVFAGIPGAEAEVLTKRMVSRLLDGQITEGPARGLWGPICVHHGMLASLLRDYLALLADLQKKEVKLKQKFSKAAEATRDEALQALNDQREIIESICQRGVRFGAVEYSWAVDPNADPQVSLPGADHCFYNQTVADLESTWVALTALSIASERNRTLTETLRPKISRKGALSSLPASPMPPPERTEAVLARAANGLVPLQDDAGRWNECNLHQPVTRFSAFTTTLPVPPDPKGFPALTSLVTAASVAQGIAALNSVGEMAGMERLLKSFNAPYATGLAARQKELEAMLAGALPKPGVRPVLKMGDFDLLLALVRPLAQGADDPAAERANALLLRTLILAGTTNGFWGAGLPATVVPTSTRARYAALKPLPSRIWMHPHDPVEMNKAHLWQGNASMARDAAGYATAVAVLYLAGHVENPAGAAEEVAGSPAMADLRVDVEKQLLSKPKPKPKTPPAPVVPPPAAPAPPVVKSEAPPAVAADNDVPAVEAPPVDAAPRKDEAL